MGRVRKVLDATRILKYSMYETRVKEELKKIGKEDLAGDQFFKKAMKAAWEKGTGPREFVKEQAK